MPTYAECIANRPTGIAACGCAFTSLLGRGDDLQWACGLHDCTEQMDPPPDLSQRKARCTYCSRVEPSDFEQLAFFKYRADHETDQYYCGCRGWS